MNIQDRLRDFRPGISISRADFTPDVQEDIIMGSMGLRRDPVMQADENSVMLDRKQFDAMTTMLQNFQTVFTAPGVAERLGEIIGYPGVRPQQPALQQYQPAPVPATAPAPVDGATNTTGQAPLNTPAPQTDAAGADWWNGILGTSDASAQQAQAPAQPGQTGVPAQAIDNQTTTTQQAQPTAQQATAVAQPDPTMQYVNAISAAAIGRGINPQEVISFYDNLTPEKAIELFAAIRGATPPNTPTTSINVAEHNPPTSRIPVDRSLSGLGYETAVNRNAFRV